MGGSSDTIGAAVAEAERMPDTTAAPLLDAAFDAFAQGYPVPPLPGQSLPPSPRRAKVTAPAGAPASEEEDNDG